MKDINLVGRSFTRWKVVKVNNLKRYHYICRCLCGNYGSVLKYRLLNKTSKSCGCLHKEIVRDTQTLHNMTGTRFYNIYQSMKYRCSIPSHTSYKYYGGRGIKCLWTTFEKFKCDMYQSYLKHCTDYGIKETTIDRNNNDGDYCEENCSWKTMREQSHNRGKLPQHR